MQDLWKDLLARKSPGTESPGDKAAVGSVSDFGFWIGDCGIENQTINHESTKG